MCAIRHGAICHLKGCGGDKVEMKQSRPFLSWFYAKYAVIMFLGIYFGMISAFWEWLALQGGILFYDFVLVPYLAEECEK